MAKQTKLTVTTPDGTFTRTTARVYSHITIAGPQRHEVLEAGRLARIASNLETIAEYQRTIDTGECQDARSGSAGEFDRKYTAEWLADGSYAKWVAQYKAENAELEAAGPITKDDGPVFCLGWSGRLDLAQTVASDKVNRRYRWVKIYDVATGQEVR